MVEAVDNTSSTRQWIEKGWETFTHHEAVSTDIAYKFATRFYAACLRVFRMFLHYIPRIPHLQKDVTEIAKIKENFGRLFLWGEGFQDGDLDKALEQSDEIRDSVLKLLFGV